MKYWRVLVTLPMIDPERGPEAVNTFHWRWTEAGDVEDAYALVASNIEEFYGTIGPTILGNNLTGDGRLTIYDLTDPEPRSVIFEDLFSFDVNGDTDPFPSEVAMCVSYRGALEAGVNRRRNRGRIYLGPLANSVASYGAGYALFTSTARDTVAGAAAGMITGPPVEWCVFSRAEAGVPIGAGDAYSEAQLTDAFREIVHGYVDDAPDTQRRRGTDPTSSTPFG